ncbi:MAG: type II secretion system protein [Lachnospiraceae bacterium]|nr:type II secretion system protein [Lachnospiraceae bacterium]
MKESKSRRKLNNQGLSLIEVLVAIIILAIVTGPLLQSLVTGIRLNAKAKEKQRLTTAAQSIMEGLKAYDVEHISMQFNGWGMRLIANATSYYEEPISDRNGDGTFDVSIDPLNGNFLPASDGRYAFVLVGVKFDGMEGIADKFYDARIDISPNTVWNPSLAGDGSVGLIDVVDMNEYLDAVYKQPANMDQSMYALIVQNLLDELNDKNESGDELELHDLEIMAKPENGGAKLTVNKIITVTVSEGGDSSINIVTIETKYIYEATGFTYTNAAGDEQELEFSGEEFAADSGTVVYNNTNTAANGARLENVYIYYYPAYPRYSPYSSSETTIATEKIILQNNTSEKDFYLVKQIDNSISHANLSVYENKYSASVAGSGAITLYHNLNEDLSTGNMLFTPSISGVTEGASGSMIGNTQEILLYNVKISLYEEGAAAAGFPPEALLLELNGSMND